MYQTYFITKEKFLNLENIANSFAGDDIDLNQFNMLGNTTTKPNTNDNTTTKPNTNDNTTTKPNTGFVSKLGSALTFSNSMLNPFSKNTSSSPQTTQPYFTGDGAEYKITDAYLKNTEHGPVLRTNSRATEDLNPYEDIPFIKNIIVDEKGDKKDLTELSTKDKKLIKKINNIFPDYSEEIPE